MCLLRTAKTWHSKRHLKVAEQAHPILVYLVTIELARNSSMPNTFDCIQELEFVSFSFLPCLGKMTLFWLFFFFTIHTSNQMSTVYSQGLNLNINCLNFIPMWRICENHCEPCRPQQNVILEVTFKVYPIRFDSIQWNILSCSKKTTWIFKSCWNSHLSVPIHAY